MPQYTSIPYVSYHPTRCTFYSQLEPAPNNPNSCNQFTTGHHPMQPGNLSNQARKKLQLAVQTLVELSGWKTGIKPGTTHKFRFKINFLTLTLPGKQSLSDKEITRKALSEFLRKWKKRNPLLLYVWKAEIQDNGRIHYHLTTNQYYNAFKLRRDWNKQLQKLGIIHPKLKLQANSTDVHSVSKIKNLAAYLCTYYNKKDNYKRPLKRFHRLYDKKLKALSNVAYKLPKNYLARLKRKPTCKLWDCSKPLKSPTIIRHYDDPELIADNNRIYETLQPYTQEYYFSFYTLSKQDKTLAPNLYKAWRKTLLNRIAEDAGAIAFNKWEL